MIVRHDDYLLYARGVNTQYYASEQVNLLPVIDETGIGYQPPDILA
jgi:hypothetical protein